jgi:hypothetical protein
MAINRGKKRRRSVAFSPPDAETEQKEELEEAEENAGDDAQEGEGSDGVSDTVQREWDEFREEYFESAQSFSPNSL